MGLEDISLGFLNLFVSNQYVSQEKNVQFGGGILDLLVLWFARK